MPDWGRTALLALALFVAMCVVMVLMLAWTAFGAGTTYHVSQAGSDANSCSAAQTATGAKRTVAAGVACLHAGETLYVHAGTYAEHLNLDAVPSGGGSWASATVISGAPGEAKPTLQIMDGEPIVGSGTARDAWVVLQDVEIGGVPGNPSTHGIFVDGTSRLRFQRLNIHDSRENGIFLSASTAHNEVLNSDISQVGLRGPPNAGHAIYAPGDGHVFEGNYLHDCPTSCYGFHLYARSGPVQGSKNALVRNNTVERVGTGLIFAFDSGNVATNNTFVHNAGPGIFDAAVGSRFEGNTIAFNGGCAFYQNTGGGGQLLNNTFFGNAGGTVCVDGGSAPTQAGTSTSNPGPVGGAPASLSGAVAAAGGQGVPRLKAPTGFRMVK